ncbi:flagellar hook-length control protein FliK [Teredinibacter turnerae]|uniref:flagellar hook-length control protein FliK n=1 Tax=Teredinibacter turnerae TaxID=2426 RepID=UPI0030CE46F9
MKVWLMQSLLESASSLDTVSTQKHVAKKLDSFASTDGRDTFRHALDQERKAQAQADSRSEEKAGRAQDMRSSAKKEEMAEAAAEIPLAGDSAGQTETQERESITASQEALGSNSDTAASLEQAHLKAEANSGIADGAVESDTALLSAEYPAKDSAIPASGIEVSPSQIVASNIHSSGRGTASPLTPFGGVTSAATVSAANGANAASLTDVSSLQGEPLKSADPQLSTDLAGSKLSGLVASSPATKMLTAETFSRLSGDGEIKEFAEVMANASGHSQTAASAAKAELSPYALAQGTDKIPVTIRFGQTAWAGQVAERTAMMVAQNLSSADLQLDPPELGPLQVKVSVHNDQATVTFVSANAQVREALDQSANRLRDMLAQQGVALGDVNVSDHPSQQSGHQQSQDGETHHARGAGSGIDLLDGEDAAPVTVWAAPTGVDYYA